MRDVWLSILPGQRELTLGNFDGVLNGMRIMDSHWMVSTGGGCDLQDPPSHWLEISATERIPTNEFIRRLVGRGVCLIDLWCPDAYQAAEGLVAQLESDPQWLQPLQVLQIHFHGDPAHPNVPALDCFENECQELDSVYAYAPPRKEILSVTTRTTVSFDPKRREVLVATIEAPGRADILQRLSTLDNEAQRKQLVGNYLTKCCVLGWAAELEAALAEFPAHLVDVNYKPTRQADSMLTAARVAGHGNIVRLLGNFAERQAQIAGQLAVAPQAGSFDVLINDVFGRLPFEFDLNRAIELGVERGRKLP